MFGVCCATWGRLYEIGTTHKVLHRLQATVSPSARARSETAVLSTCVNLLKSADESEKASDQAFPSAVSRFLLFSSLTNNVFHSTLFLCGVLCSCVIFTCQKHLNWNWVPPGGPSNQRLDRPNVMRVAIELFSEGSVGEGAAFALLRGSTPTNQTINQLISQFLHKLCDARESRGASRTRTHGFPSAPPNEEWALAPATGISLSRSPNHGHGMGNKARWWIPSPPPFPRAHSELTQDFQAAGIIPPNSRVELRWKQEDPSLDSC